MYLLSPIFPAQRHLYMIAMPSAGVNIWSKHLYNTFVRWPRFDGVFYVASSSLSNQSSPECNLFVLVISFLSLLFAPSVGSNFLCNFFLCLMHRSLSYSAISVSTLCVPSVQFSVHISARSFSLDACFLIVGPSKWLQIWHTRQETLRLLQIRFVLALLGEMVVVIS